jgi:hypothetical protein
MNRQSQWLFELPVTSEATLYTNPEWESKKSPRSKAPTKTRVCSDRGIPGRILIPAKVPTIGKVKCTKAQAFGETDPFGVISRAVKRALEMLDNTISELVNARKAVCGGATPAWPLLGDITICLLKNGLSVDIDDIRVWTAGTFVNRSIAEVIRRLIRVRNLIASNGIRYFCDNGRCNPGDPPVCNPNIWAFVCMPDPCPKGAKDVDSIVHLCQSFWVPAVRNDGKPVPPAIHSEFQAQTIIHEASHLYHCTEDSRGRTIGVAECLSQFVAATNGSPIDVSFAERCTGMNRCFPPGEIREFESSGIGSARLSSARVAKTIFRPQNVIWLKGRLAIRR